MMPTNQPKEPETENKKPMPNPPGVKPMRANLEPEKLPDAVAAIKGIVSEEIAFQIIDRLELEARRRAGNLSIGCIVFDAAYGEFRKLKPAPEPEQPQHVNEDADTKPS
jgi:hypothetical protein